MRSPRRPQTARNFLSFVKTEAMLFGIGRVLLAFLRPDFAGPDLLTDQQLLDTVAVGQVVD